MPRYIVTLTNDEIQDLKALIQKGGNGYCIELAQILLKLNRKPDKVDSVYVRNDVADVFMISEPLAGMRETVVTQTRTALYFAEILRYTSDTLYPRTEK